LNDSLCFTLLLLVQPCQFWRVVAS
jgi:hypothetical protein